MAHLDQAHRKDQEYEYTEFVEDVLQPKISAGQRPLIPLPSEDPNGESRFMLSRSKY